MKLEFILCSIVANAIIWLMVYRLYVKFHALYRKAIKKYIWKFMHEKQLLEGEITRLIEANVTHWIIMTSHGVFYKGNWAYPQQLGGAPDMSKLGWFRNCCNTIYYYELDDEKAIKIASVIENHKKRLERVNQQIDFWTRVL